MINAGTILETIGWKKKNILGFSTFFTKTQVKRVSMACLKQRWLNNAAVD
jgi:hypothetical protein